ncbi:MAG: carboxypeptidase regulatory-like domain-containing protein [Acidobacteriota bacterium]
MILFFSLGLSALGVFPALGLELKGQILDGDGRPAENVTVDLMSEPTAYEAARAVLAGEAFGGETVDAALTGADGWFVLRAPEEGFYRVRAELDGFVPMEVSVHPLLEPKTLHTLRLRPSFEQRIVVLGLDGEPLGEAWIHAHWRAVSGGPWDLAAIRHRGWGPAPRRAVTGADGTASIPFVASEYLAVYAGHRDLVRAWNLVTGPTARRLAFAPAETRQVRIVDVLGRPAAVLVRLEEGAPRFTDVDGMAAFPADLNPRRPVDLITPEGLRFRTKWNGEAEIRLPRVIEQRGAVVDAADDAGVSGAFIWKDGLSLLSTRSGRGGEFLWRVFEPAANLGVIHADAEGYRKRKFSKVGEVRLEPTRPVFGRVIDADGAPLAGVEVHLDDEHQGQRAIRPSTFSDSLGHYRFNDLSREKTYTLRAHLPPRPVAAALAPPPEDEVDLVFADGGRVLGRLVDGEGEPIVGGTVSIYHQAGDGEAHRRLSRENAQSAGPATSGPDGFFSLDGVGAGRHVVLIGSASTARRLLPGVVVRPGEDQDIGDITLQPGVDLQVRAVDVGGEPIPDVRVNVHFEFPRSLSGDLRSLLSSELGSEGLTDTRGRARLGPRAPGTGASVNFSHPDYVSVHRRLAVSSVEVEQVLHRQATIRGRVVDEAGRPVLEGLVSATQAGKLAGPGGRRTSMALSPHREGTFTLSGLTPGEITIGVEAEGYALTEVTVDLGPGEDSEDLVISMTPGAQLEGRVFSEGGEPVVGARFSLVSKAASRPGGRPSVSRSATSEDGGFYRLDGLTQGRYVLYISHPDFLRYVGDIEVASPQASRDFQLEGLLLSIAGRVVDAEGEPVADATVRLESELDRFRSQKSDGGFRFGVPRNGTYRVVASRPGSASATETVEVDGASIDGLLLRLDPGAKIVGRVTDLAAGEGEMLAIRATEIRPLAAYGATEWRTGVADLDGAFTVEAIGVGRWRVTASLEGRQVEASREVVVAPGDREVQVELELGGRGLPLRGTVLHNGEPAANVRVKYDTMTDAAGRFQLEGIQPGTVGLPLTGPWGEYRWVRESWAGEEVVIEITTFQLSGRVIDSLGVGAGGLRVRVLGAELQSTRSTVTDGEGYFTFPNQPAGSYRAFAEGDDRRGMKVVDLEMDRDRTDVLIELQRTAELVVEPLRLDGGPVESLMLIALDGAGEVVGAEQVRRTDGVFRARRLPPGQWQVVIRVDGAMFEIREVTIPGEPLRVELEPAAGLEIEVPALESVPRATVRVFGPDGELYGRLPPSLAPNAPRIHRGRGSIPSIPAGLWTLRVETSDGRIFEGTVETDGLRRTSVTLK